MRAEVGFVIRNNKTLVVCEPHAFKELRNKFRVRSPGAFYSEAFRRRAWDGFIYYIDKNGFIDTGLLPEFIEYCQEQKWQYEIEDERVLIKPKALKHDYGTFKLRGYQFKAVKALKYYSVGRKSGRVPFQRGILQAATNAGKTAISAAVAKLFGKKTLYLINRKDYYEEALPMFRKYLPGKVGFLNAKGVEWNDFMVCMVPTIHRNLLRFEDKIREYDVVIVDECDLATSKMWTVVLQKLYNTPIRVGLSGTAQVGLLKKDEIKNRKIRSFFGGVIFEIKAEDLEKKGYSSPIEMEILRGNVNSQFKKDFTKEYKRGIILNATRNRLISELVLKHVDEDQVPILIITKNHLHVDKLYNRLMPISDKAKFTLSRVHHKTLLRQEIVTKFAQGKIDVLVASMILARAKNFPLMKVMINAGGGDSIRNALQMLGRARRTHKSKTKTYYYDFFDKGAYLQRHSKHRILAYRKENLVIKETYKTIKV